MDTVKLNHLVNKNQTIKIVPPIEELLCKMGLNVYLDENTKMWLMQLKDMWRTWKKSPTIENHIENFFQNMPDPYRVTLIFIINCDDTKDCKPKTLPYSLVETLLKWSKTSKVYPEEYLKFPAFNIGIQQRNQNFLNLIVKTYQLSTLKDTILPIVKNMIKNDNCRQASQIVSAMHLFDEIPVEQLMFPFVLQDKVNLVDIYLSECPSQVKPLLDFLDKLLDKKFNLREYVQSYVEENKIGQVRYEKMHYKPLGKLVARLCVKFNVPIETCKNLSQNRTTSGLKFLIHQKYQEQKLSSSVWEDLVKDSLRQSAGSADEFIKLLSEYDKAEALKWAEYLDLPDDQLPLSLKEISLTDTPEEECWDSNIDSQEYFNLDLPSDKIIMVDTAEKFYDLMNTDIVKCYTVGLDCEWKPSFGASQSHVALIQIATIDKVYLIDTLVLNKPDYASFWYSFNKNFIENGEIIKIGFGLELDLKEMKTSIIGLGNVRVNGEGFLDLFNLWKALLENGISLPSNSDCSGKSLSSLVQACFGLPLQKTEQCSNWELRPLRETQLRYAALDAYVLIQLYNYLQKLCNKKGLNFEEICNDVMTGKRKKCVKKTKVIQNLQFNLLEVKSVKCIRLLVEPPLSHLMCYLRYCGIDTNVIPVTMLWHDVVNMAISEERHVIAAKLKCTPTVNFPQSSILDVGKGTVAENLQRIFTQFNIAIKQDDLLSLCVNCNSKNLTLLNVNEVQKLCYEYETSKCSSVLKTRVPSDNEDNYDYDNFLSDSDDELFEPVATYPNKPNCLTSTGAVVEIHNVSELCISNKTAILCESCGKLYWDKDDLLEEIIDTVYKITKLNFSWNKDKK